ncbi:hypothetical protein PFISCL1PPCAC_2160, partial [Pristionchus fissidentatus]
SLLFAAISDSTRGNDHLHVLSARDSSVVPIISSLTFVDTRGRNRIHAHSALSLPIDATFSLVTTLGDMERKKWR